MVWDEVKKQRAAVSETVEVTAAAPMVAAELAQTSSYAKVMENEEVRKQVDAVAKPIEQNYQSLIAQLRDRHAVGVVVAVNGRIIWADIFAMEGRKETIESEPGVYRHTEVTGDGFKAFALTSLLPKTGFDLHVAKMAE